MRDMPSLNQSKIFLVKAAALASLCVSFSLIGVKYWVWYISDSISLQASLLDSLLDGLASIGNFIAIHHAQRPPDKEHRFGHGKLEAISALIQSLLIFLSGLWVLKEAVMRSLNPQMLQETAWGIRVILLSTLLTALLVIFQKHVVRKTNSLAISADSAHYKMDFIINIGILLTLHFGSRYPWLDPLSGGLIGIYILASCYQIFIHSVHILMDRELGDDIRQKIRNIILSNPKVLGVHDLRTRSSGHINFIQAHLEMNPELSLQVAHDIAEKVELQILQQMPNCEILIHIDPPLSRQ